MKEKSQIEKKAEEKQITLLSTALSEASNAGGHWLNASGKGYPRLYPKGVSVSAFNALFMTLHSDKMDAKPTSSRYSAMPRHKEPRCVRMNKAFHFCFIIGTSTFTAIIQNRLSVVMTT